MTRKIEDYMETLPVSLAPRSGKKASLRAAVAKRIAHALFLLGPENLGRALLVCHQNARLGIVGCRDVMKRYVNIFALGLAVLDQHRRDALGNLALLFRGTSLDPGNLDVRHSLLLRNQRFFSPYQQGFEHSSCFFRGLPFGTALEWRSGRPATAL